MLSGSKFLATLAASAMLFLGAASLKAADEGSITGTVLGKDGKTPAANASVRLSKPGQGGPGGRRQPGGNAPKAAPQAADAPKPDAPKDAPKPGGPGGNRPAPLMETKTGTDGKFTFDKVPAGDYVVAAGDRETGFARENVTVKSGEAATVSITLKDRPAGGRGPGGAGGNKPADPK
jgi:hypothetical protein